MNGSLLAKEFVFSKTIGLQQATLLNNDLLNNYFRRSLTASVNQPFCRTPYGICFYDYGYAPFISVGFEPQKQTTESVRDFQGTIKLYYTLPDRLAD